MSGPMIWDLVPDGAERSPAAGRRREGHHLFVARTGPAAVTFDAPVDAFDEAVLDALLTLAANGAAAVAVDDVFREIYGCAEACRNRRLRRRIERSAARLAETRAYVGGRCAGRAVPPAMLAA